MQINQTSNIMNTENTIKPLSNQEIRAIYKTFLRGEITLYQYWDKIEHMGIAYCAEVVLSMTKAQDRINDFLMRKRDEENRIYKLEQRRKKKHVKSLIALIPSQYDPSHSTDLSKIYLNIPGFLSIPVENIQIDSNDIVVNVRNPIMWLTLYKKIKSAHISIHSDIYDLSKLEVKQS
jgi:hypothetical protein